MNLVSHVAQENHEEEEDMVKDKVKVRVSKSVKKIKIQLKRAINVKKNTYLKKIMSFEEKFNTKEAYGNQTSGPQG